MDAQQLKRAEELKSLLTQTKRKMALVKVRPTVLMHGIGNVENVSAALYDILLSTAIEFYDALYAEYKKEFESL